MILNSILGVRFLLSVNNQVIRFSVGFSVSFSFEGLSHFAAFSQRYRAISVKSAVGGISIFLFTPAPALCLGLCSAFTYYLPFLTLWYLK